MIIKGNEYLIKYLWKNGPEIQHKPARYPTPRVVHDRQRTRSSVDAALKAFDIAISQADWAGGKMLAHAAGECGPRFLYQIENHPEY